MGVFDFAFSPDINALKQKRDIPGLVKVLQQARKPSLRIDAARALGELGEQICRPELYACLDDADENVRAASAEALNAIDQLFGEKVARQPQREMRVFISSTFRDMQKERDILIRQVFPFIRQLCRTRGVGFTEVDLRWGVTEQQAERGEVLPVCIAEIENSRPYFIGLLGERYGWIPSRIEPDLAREQPWLKEHQDASVTELEILHGVLNHPESVSRALFYFRDPAYVDRLPPGERPDYVSEDLLAKEKLQGLKERIRISHLPLVENYPDPQELGKLVQSDLVKQVDQDFPAPSLAPFDREMANFDLEMANQESFAETRRRVYIRRAEILAKIYQHVQTSRVPLVLTGESGMGKSALLANWAEEYRLSHPETFVLSHFIGATDQSTSHIAIQSRLMAELKRHFQIDRALPTSPDEIKKVFPEWLRLAADRGSVLLILDGLNQLEDQDNAPDLVWLPQTFPSSITVILSTLPGRSLEAARKRGWQELEVNGLETADRKRLIYSYLAKYRKRLNNGQVDKIVAARQTSNPLFLKALLDELRIFGVFEKLDERINLYLQSETVGVLYHRILERLEQDYTYADGRSGLVKEALSLLWAARDGLYEDELLTLLGQGGELLPRAVWSPLYLSIQDSLVSRAGKLAFFHNYLKESVQQRYLPQPEDQKGAHRRLGEFFEPKPIDQRLIRELPWQWQQAEEWSRLAGLLGGLDFFSQAWQSSEYELKSYWSNLEARSALRAVDAYQPVFDAPEQHLTIVRDLSVLMSDIGHMRESIALREFLVDYYRALGEKDRLVGALNSLAVLFAQRGDLKGAALLEHEAEQLVMDGVASTEEQIVTANNKAALMEASGNVSGALEIWERLAVFCRENERLRELPAMLNNMGKALKTLGKWQKALEEYQESERICQETGNTTHLIIALAGQANILGSLSRYDEASRISQKATQLCRELGDKLNLVALLSSQATLYLGRGNPEQAWPLALEGEQIARELGDQPGLANALIEQGLIEQARGNFDLALTHLREAEKICRQMGSKEQLHGALGNQATVLRRLGRPQEALRLQKEVEQICREMGDLRGLQTSLGNQANIHTDMNNLEVALDLHRQKVAICREIGFVSGLALGLTNQAAVLMMLGRPQEALTCADEAAGIAQQYQLTTIQPLIQQIRQEAGR